MIPNNFEVKEISLSLRLNCSAHSIQVTSMTVQETMRSYNEEHLYVPLLIFSTKRWFVETPTSFLNTLPSLFVVLLFSPVLAEFFRHLLLLALLREPGKQAKNHIIVKDQRHPPTLPFFQQYAILEPYRIYSQSQEQQRRLRDARFVFPS